MMTAVMAAAAVAAAGATTTPATTTTVANTAQQTTPPLSKYEQAVMADVRQAYERVAARCRTRDGEVPLALTQMINNEDVGAVYMDVNRELIARRSRFAATSSTSSLYTRVLRWHAMLRRRRRQTGYDTFFASDDVELRLWVEGVLEYYCGKLTDAFARMDGATTTTTAAAATPSAAAAAMTEKGKGKRSTRKRTAAAKTTTATTTTMTTTTTTAVTAAESTLSHATLQRLFATAAARVTTRVCRSAALVEAVALASDLMQAFRIAHVLAQLFIEDTAAVRQHRRNELFHVLLEYAGGHVWLERYVVLLIGAVHVYGDTIVRELQQEHAQQQQRRPSGTVTRHRDATTAAMTGKHNSAATDTPASELKRLMHNVYDLIVYCADMNGFSSVDLLQLLVLQCARYVCVLAFPPHDLMRLVRQHNRDHKAAAVAVVAPATAATAATAAAAATAATDATAPPPPPVVFTLSQWHDNALVRYVTHDAVQFATRMADFLVSAHVQREWLLSVMLQQLLCFDTRSVAAAAGDDNNDNKDGNKDDKDDEEEATPRPATALRWDAVMAMGAVAATTAVPPHKHDANNDNEESDESEDEEADADDESDDESEEDNDNEEEDVDDEDSEDDEAEEEDDAEDDEDDENEDDDNEDEDNEEADDEDDENDVEEDEDEEAANDNNVQVTQPSTTTASSDAERALALSIDIPAVLTACCTRTKQQQQQQQQEHGACFLEAALCALLTRVLAQLLSAHASNVVHTRGVGDTNTTTATAAATAGTRAQGTAAAAAAASRVRVVVNVDAAVRDARAALYGLLDAAEQMCVPAQTPLSSWPRLSLCAQDTVAVPFGRAHVHAALTLTLHACMLQLLRYVTQPPADDTTTTTAAAIATLADERALLPFYAHLVQTEPIYHALTSLVPATVGTTATATTTTTAQTAAPAAAAAAAAATPPQGNAQAASLLSSLHNVFYTAVSSALRVCYPDNAGRVLIVPIVNSMHVYLKQQEETDSSNSSGNNATAVARPVLQDVVVLTSEAELAVVARLVSCVAERDTFFRKYTDVCQRRLLARAEPGDDDVDVVDARKRRCEQLACALLQTALGDGPELRQLADVCASLQSATVTVPITAARAADATTTAGEGAEGKRGGGAATLTLHVVPLPWKLWGYHAAAHLRDDARTHGVEQLAGRHALAPTPRTPLPFPRELHAAMTQYERVYASAHANRQLRWRRAAECYSTFAIAFPRDEGRRTTVHGSLLLHQLYLAIAQYRRAGVSYTTLASRVGDMTPVALAQMLHRHVTKFGLLVHVPPPPQTATTTTTAKATTTTAATASGGGGGAGAIDVHVHVALNYDYTRPAHVRHGEYAHYPPRISHVPPLDEAEMRRVQMERRFKTQVAIVQTMKSAHEMAHAELFARTQSKLQHAFELRRDMFKVVLEQLMEKGYIERANSNAAAAVYRYRA